MYIMEAAAVTQN